ncbi:MAG TPA: tetratricopeptide repeat protein, partial [Chthoniobacteraceae bacterium]
PSTLTLVVRLSSLLLFAALPLRAAEPAEAEKLFIAGDYAGVVTAANQAMNAETSSVDPAWPVLLSQGLMAEGEYAKAREVLTEAIKKYPLDIRIRFAAYQAFRSAGATEEAKTQLAEIDRLAAERTWAYREPTDRLVLGKAALLLGADPKRVLQVFYDPVRKEQANFRDVWIATGELALAKNDFALAAKTFGEASKKFADDPDVWFGLARAYAPSNPEATRDALEKTFAANPNHVGAWLLLADSHIDAENYADADTALDAALKTNPHLPEAFAYRAVLAELRGDSKAAAEARAKALEPWPTNPAVVYLIGHKLAQKYRFAEGAALQREALQFDPDYLPAKAELANDLLRRGQDEEGWKLVEEVHKADPYDVVAYNLTRLREALSHFQTLTSEHFTVRMDPQEASVYGAEVLALLERAYTTLTQKYGLPLLDRTIVEIFPDQKDFAIRTFGLPGGAGYLGVCFGHVITANSPASRPGSPANWQSILWHEFTHVITLSLTKNKMPRWLSEGISVFEERQARGSWGEQMKPRYRAMILGEDLTPVSQLSGAFLHPKSPAHLGFAYYESSLVAEWLVQRWGLEKMKALLADLAGGKEINAALAAHFEPIEQLDAEFAARAVALARGTGPSLDWTPPNPGEAKSVDAFVAANPDNFSGLLAQARELVGDRKWQEAKAPLQKLITLYPDQHDSSGPYMLLAECHRGLGETDAEWTVLNRLVDLTSDAEDALLRLMQLAMERHDWTKALEFAQRDEAIDPLHPEAHLCEAEAAEAMDQRDRAISAYRTLLKLSPADPAEIHFRLARLLHEGKDPAAKHEVLLSLEDAPRFRAALDLLWEISGKPSSDPGVQKRAP